MRAPVPLGEVAVFDADVPTALAFTRSLGRAGVPVKIYSHRDWPMARLSRYCRGYERCPEVASPAFLPWLRRELTSKRIQLVAPTSDLLAFQLAQVRDLF